MFQKVYNLYNGNYSFILRWGIKRTQPSASITINFINSINMDIITKNLIISVNTSFHTSSFIY
jgi:hypothetical protein